MLSKIKDTSKANSLVSKINGLQLLVDNKFFHEAWLLLLYCVAPTVGYVQRSAPPSETLSMAEVTDDMLSAIGAIITSLPLDVFSNERVRRQFFLSCKNGGAGIRSAVAANQFSYIASLEDFGHACCSRWPHIREALASAGIGDTSDLNPEHLSLTPDGEVSRAAWMRCIDHQRRHIIANYTPPQELDFRNMFNTSTFTEGPILKGKHQELLSKLDSRWRRQGVEALVGEELAFAESAGADVITRQRHSVWWQETASDGRCNWTRVPTANKRHYLTGPELEFATRRLLRLPLRNFCAGHTCMCGKAVDAFGDHPDCCPLLQDQRSRRHHRVNAVAVHAIARQAGLQAEIEAPHLNADNNGRPADTAVPFGLENTFGNRVVCYDVVGIGSAVEHYLESACSNVGGAMAFGIKRKLRSTRLLSDDKVVVPLPFTSQGSLHSNFRDTYVQWAEYWAGLEEGRSENMQRNLVYTWVTQASATVQKAQWRLTQRLAALLQTTNPKSGQIMTWLQPLQSHMVDSVTVPAMPT